MARMLSTSPTFNTGLEAVPATPSPSRHLCLGGEIAALGPDPIACRVECYNSRGLEGYIIVLLYSLERQQNTSASPRMSEKELHNVASFLFVGISID